MKKLIISALSVIPGSFFLSALYNFVELIKNDNSQVLLQAKNYLLSDGSLVNMAIYGGLLALFFLVPIIYKKIQHANAEYKKKKSEQRKREIREVLQETNFKG